MPEQAEQIILRLLEKDPRRRFRDGHHLQEELKAFQRTLPHTWEVQPKEGDNAPVAQPPPPPAPTPGVVEWSRRAAYFSRMLARAYPNGVCPTRCRARWTRSGRWPRARVGSRARLASHQRKLEAIERRGRALRAEIGRKVEELAEEESRALREAAAERERLARVKTKHDEARKNWDKANETATTLERTRGDAARWRQAFEEATGAKARAEVLAEVYQDHERRALRKEKSASDLRRQIDELRAQLARYGDALENDLAAGRDRIATRVREALQYEKTFADMSAALMRICAGAPRWASSWKRCGAKRRSSRSRHSTRLARGSDRRVQSHRLSPAGAAGPEPDQAADSNESVL